MLYFFKQSLINWITSWWCTGQESEQNSAINTMTSQLESAMEGLIKVFHSYSSKEGDKYKLSKAEMKSLLQGELSEFLAVSGLFPGAWCVEVFNPLCVSKWTKMLI